MVETLVRWRRRRQTRAELARLAQVGDYLLHDVGLDPELVRQDPAGTIDRITAAEGVRSGMSP
jgi:hypothetical protein